MTRSVAVIGIGAMGGPIARRLQAGGFDLTVCDRSEGAIASFSGSGAKVANTPADCANADLVIVMVATPDQVWEALLGEQGLVEGVETGKEPLVALMGTMSPEAVRNFEAALAERRVRMLDAPVSGGVPRAIDGTLTILIGGAEADIAAARPAFECIGNNQFHLGPVGSAQVLKILNNILGIANGVLSAETYRLALEYGLNLGEVARAFDTGTARNWLSSFPAGPVTAIAMMTTSKPYDDSRWTVIRKDLDLALELAAKVDGKYTAIEGLAALVHALGQDHLRSWQRVAAEAELAD